jgi:hypothetical protein
MGKSIAEILAALVLFLGWDLVVRDSNQSTTRSISSKLTTSLVIFKSPSALSLSHISKETPISLQVFGLSLEFRACAVSKTLRFVY